MKTKILFFLLLSSTLRTWAQTIVSPTYYRRDNISLEINEVDRTAQYTIIKGVYKNVMHYGWVCINNTTYLKDSKSEKKYGTIIKSEGLPVSPAQYQFSKENESISFKFYFPAIPDDVEMIDMIENDTSTSAFNFYGIALKENLNRPFSVTYDAGHRLSSKPSLASRINGVKEIQVYIPLNLTELDRYIFGNFVSYLQGLNIRVDIVQALYENSAVQMGTVQGYYRVFKEDVSDYLKNSNTLAVVLNYVCSAGNYVGDTSINITFVDYCNGYTWNISQFELPNKSDKYINKLKKLITSTYSYSTQYSFRPPSIATTWNGRILREYLSNDTSNPLEGIYEGEQYTIGVKKGDDGNYYLLYLAGAENHEDWKEGDVKATLTSTSTPTLFKADWLGRWKQNMNMFISFVNGALVTIDEGKDKETYIKMFPNARSIVQNSASSGTGFFLSKDGYIITNYHVIENAQTIKVLGINDDIKNSYTARVEISDKQNDLAILKITDVSFRPLTNIPYTFKYTTSSVGENCFVLGYPLISSMGLDIKLTNGIISAKTGYEGNIAEYQISAPIQPGNSGGPLFDKNGCVIGIVCAKHREAENAGYAIKASYIRNLIELLPSSLTMPKNNLLIGKSLPKQVELASKAVCIIIVNGDK